MEGCQLDAGEKSGGSLRNEPPVRVRRERPSVRRWWVGPALAASTLVVVLGALEAGFRIALDPVARAALPHVGLHKEDQDRVRWAERAHAERNDGLSLNLHDRLLGWRPRPGLRTRRAKPRSFDVEVAINQAGLRGAREVTRAKTPGVTRIAIFGCSQTFGAGVVEEETFAAQLAATLPGVEVLNFGVGGYGTDQMLLYLESEGLAWAPDVVVLAFAYYHIERNQYGFPLLRQAPLHPGGRRDAPPRRGAGAGAG
jgi:hypothetical protein